MNRVYFDSSVLRAENWPYLSSKLERLLGLADALEVRVLLPLAVERELENNWFRALRKKRDEIMGRVQAFNTYGAKIVSLLGVSGLQKEEEILPAYRRLIGELKSKWKIKTIPFTSRSTEAIFNDAIRRIAPFQHEGKGFQDAVIWYSVIDDLAKRPGQMGAFVSQDEDFREEPLMESAAASGARIKLYKSVDEVAQVIQERIVETFKQVWEKDQQEALQSLEARLLDIQKFVEENLQIYEQDLRLGGTLIAIHQIEVLKIKKVRTPFPLKREPSEPFRISADIYVKMHVRVERFTPSAPKVVKVGETLPHPEARFLIRTLGGNKQEVDETPERTVELEGSANVRDGKYQDISLVSVQLK